jgi:hypothetical protein
VGQKWKKKRTRKLGKKGGFDGQEFRVGEEGREEIVQEREKMTQEQFRTQELDLRNGTPYCRPRHLRMLAP